VRCTICTPRRTAVCAAISIRVTEMMRLPSTCMSMGAKCGSGKTIATRATGECRPCEEFEERNRYQRNRRILLKDLSGDCVLCTLPLVGTGEPIHIHHIVPRMQGGGDELSNLAPVHALCNLSASIGSDPSPTLDYRRAWVDRWRRGEVPTMIPPVPAEGWRMWGLRQILPTLPETELEELANALPKGARRDGVLN
jgi:hypothetical protein